MANTYTQIYIHLVFAITFREKIIQPTFKDELCKYLTGIIQNKGHKLLCINSMPDHVHILIGYNPAQNLSELVKIIKTSSNEFLNDKKMFRGYFSWQQGYGAFSYSRSQIDSVVHYIEDQEKHHHKKTFREEYIELLKLFNIKFDDKYLFNFQDE